MTNLSLPKLAERVTDDYAAYLFLEEIRWPNGPTCPHCGTFNQATFLKPRKDEAGKARATRTGAMSQRRVWKCRHCLKQFSVLTGTIFHGSKVPVRIWVLVVFQMASSKNGMAAREVQRLYGLPPKTAWFVCHRIREAMKDSMPDRLIGTIVADETWIGGDPKNRHAKDRDLDRMTPELHKPGTERPNGHTDKQPVFALINVETGQVRSRVVPNVTAPTLRKVIAEHVEMIRSVLHTDEAGAYRVIGREFQDHQSVNHSIGEYVRQEVTTNRLEGYFSQLKRSIDGTHHHVSREHLQRYLTEFDFRYSTCKMSDTDRMRTLVWKSDGKRLAYRVCR
ncbi:MAG: IS1595 family transposase [Acidimicrobiales bacterium]|jgi:transposase-like protein